jgi:hypothetical protein
MKYVAILVSFVFVMVNDPFRERTCAPNRQRKAIIEFQLDAADKSAL